MIDLVFEAIPHGRVTSRRDYTAFGEESVTPERAAGLGYAGQSETRKGYTGYDRDTESGLDFAQARYYNPTHGRFTSVDPLTASASAGRFPDFLLFFFRGSRTHLMVRMPPSSTVPGLAGNATHVLRRGLH